MTMMEKNWKSLTRPKKLEFVAESKTDTFGRFTAEPFERGFGTTFGNSLRRVLLSSLQGAAITAFRIEGVLHEFSTIPGVYEDATQIVLNLKELRFRVHSTTPKIISVDVEREGVITGADIITDQDVEILNPDLTIATLEKGAHLKMEMVVTLNKGFVPAERNKDEELSVDFIAVDSIHSPIVKIMYWVENARVGRMTDYDKLIMEITTDGSIPPENALAISAKIVKEHMNLFINFEEDHVQDERVEQESEHEKKKLFEKLNKHVNELELSVRSINCLQNANIDSIGELVQKTEPEMLRTKNFGRKSLNELKEILEEMGLSFGMDIRGWIPSEEEPEEAQEAVFAKSPDGTFCSAEREKRGFPFPHGSITRTSVIDPGAPRGASRWGLTGPSTIRVAESRAGFQLDGNRKARFSVSSRIGDPGTVRRSGRPPRVHGSGTQVRSADPGAHPGCC
jgi:DNA-directed RNA polymerase subunit alpha